MSTADQFRIYAKEAMLWSRKSKTEEARNAMIDPCAHMDRGCGDERAHYCRRGQSARS
jgi:hypothetical protein